MRSHVILALTIAIAIAAPALSTRMPKWSSADPSATLCVGTFESGLQYFPVDCPTTPITNPLPDTLTDASSQVPGNRDLSWSYDGVSTITMVCFDPPLPYIGCTNGTDGDQTWTTHLVSSLPSPLPLADNECGIIYSNEGVDNSFDSWYCAWSYVCPYNATAGGCPQIGTESTSLRMVDLSKRK